MHNIIYGVMMNLVKGLEVSIFKKYIFREINLKTSKYKSGSPHKMKSISIKIK